MASQHDTIIINGKNIHDIPFFYKEVNRVFMYNESWDIGESLDAFNDLLHGGFGVCKPGKPTQIVWQDSEHSRQALGYQATKEYYIAKLQPGSPFNKEYFKKKLQELEQGNGQTYFDIILEIIAEHPDIILDLK